MQITMFYFLFLGFAIYEFAIMFNARLIYHTNYICEQYFRYHKEKKDFYRFPRPIKIYLLRIILLDLPYIGFSIIGMLTSSINGPLFILKINDNFL